MGYHYGPSLKSRWLDIGQLLPFFYMLMDQNGFKFYKHCKRKEQCQYPAILTKQEWSIKVLMNLPQLRGKFLFLGTA